MLHLVPGRNRGLLRHPSYTASSLFIHSIFTFNPSRVRISRRRELGLAILGPIVNDIEIPTLLGHCEIGVECFLLVVPPDTHYTDVGVAEQCLP